MSNPQSSSPPLLRTAINDVNATLASKATNPANMMANSNVLRSDVSSRKLMRSESTFGEDIFDESLHELSQLNQRHVLRQQWFRKNNLVSRLRRSTSTASNSSSSSSSGISSGVYSNCSANTSSFASSFSSSFATLSSLSESCDTTDCTNPPSSESDYPRIIRRSSFKNKFSNCYKPYYKPRRFSLQILKGQMELPENFKFYPPKAYLFDLNSQTGGNSRYPGTSDKENSTLYTMASAATKSNPASPNKSGGTYLSDDDGCISIADSELANSMQAQIVITNSNTGSGSSQPGVGNNGQVLVRSKSLDDLNTLFCYSNQCPCAGPDNNSLMVNNPMAGGQPPTSHYASFNRIFCDSSKLTTDQPSEAPNANCTSPQLYYSSSGPPSHLQNQQLLPPEFLGVNAGAVNNLKGMSFSSREISNAGSNQAEPLNSSANNTSLCDIDSVMKKISSLRV